MIVKNVDLQNHVMNVKKKKIKITLNFLQILINLNIL